MADNREFEDGDYTDATAAELYVASVEVFDLGMHQVDKTAWERRTPCADWTVRDLVNHVVVEDLWAPPLLAGREIDEVAAEIPEDGLGGDPLGAWHHSTEHVRDAIGSDLDRPVHLTGRDVPASAYLEELAADHLIHAWDLMTALGVDATLPDSLVERVADWFTDRELMYREYGAIGPRREVGADASSQERLLAAFGR